MGRWKGGREEGKGVCVCGVWVGCGGFVEEGQKDCDGR